MTFEASPHPSLFADVFEREARKLVKHYDFSDDVTVGPLSHVVVHGHTIFEDVEDQGHRIGIDTGAFRTGVLTALVLEGTERRYIQAIERDGRITIQHG